MVVLIGVAFLTVPRETNRLVELLSKQTVYGRQRFEPSASTQHVVVCGAVGSVPTASGGADAGAGGGAAPGTSLLRLTGGTSGIIAFVREFFNDDHGTSGRHLVILARGPPSPDLAVVLAQPKHVVGITYLDGDVMSDRDLGRAAVSKAAGVFILSNKLAADMDAEDSASIIRALAVHRHSLLSTAVASPQLFVQLLRPENRALFSTTISVSAGRAGGSSQAPSHDAGSLLSSPSAKQSGPRRRGSAVAPSPRQGRDDASVASESLARLGQKQQPDPPAPISLCVQQLKASLLSKSCVCPGFATVLFNLVASDPDDASAGMDAAVGAVPPSPPPAAATLSTAQGSPSAEAAPSPASSARRWPEQGNVTNSEDTTGGSARDGDEWIDQYRQGSSYEMYRVILSAAFEGVTFEAAASLVHEELGVLLIGVEIQPPEMKSSRVLLNPVGFVLPHPSDDRVHGLVIAEDRAQADLLSHEPAWLRSSAASGSFVSRGRSRRGSGASRQRAGPADAIPSASAPWIVEAMSMSPKPGRGGPGTTRRQASAGSSVGGSAAVLAIADDGTASGRLMERLGKTAAQNRERALTGRRVSRAAIPPDLATPNRGAARSVTAQAAQPGSVQPSTTALPAAGAGARAPPDEALADMEAARWLSTSHKKMRREQARAARTNVPARTLAEATLASTSDPASGLRAFSGHVVVMCRRRPGDLLDFVQPLRARHLARFPPIVVLCPEPPRDEHWLKLSAFPQVWFVLGSPMRAADLVRVGLASAACCVMYEQADGGPVAVDATRSDALIDADAICVYRLIRSIAPAAEIVVEVARLESVAFLDDAGGADSLCPATERLAFSAGHVFTSSFVDICLCQAFFNQHIITIVEHLVGVGDTAPCREWDRSAVAARLGKPVSSNVYSVAVPRSLVGKTLGDAFRALCVTRGMLPIGLRRRRVAAPGSSVDNSSAAEELSRRLAGSLAAVNESDTEEEEEDNFSYRPAGEPWDGPEAVGFAGASEMDGDELESLSSTPEPPMTKRGVEGSPPRGPGSSRDEQHDGKAGVWRVANVASRASAAVRASRAEGSNAGSAYVVTNPPASLVLRRSDSMFVLAARAPEPADARDALPRIASLSDLRRGRSFK